MSTQTPETIVNHIIKYLSEHNLSGEWSSVDSENSKRSALTLRSVNVGEGDMVLGIIHCLDKNIPEMRKAFKNAIAYLPDVSAPMVNYARCLRNVGMYSEALSVAMDLELFDKSNETYLLLSSLCACMGFEGRAQDYFSMSGLPQRKLDIILEDARSSKNIRPEVMDIVNKSFIKDAAIWESLAKR